MNTTPDGLVLYPIHADELKKHLHKRAAHHIKRNEELVAKGKAKDAELNSKVDEADTVTDRMAMKGSSNYSDGTRERDNFFNLAREHARKATRFTFLAEHCPASSAGYLDIAEAELSNLEFFVSSDW